MEYTDLLRRLAIHDVQIAEDGLGHAGLSSPHLDPKAVALVRLGALIAVGGAEPSYGASADDAVSAGATADEIVDVLLGVLPVVGYPCVVAAAPKLALALGHDVIEVVELSSEG